MLVYVYYADLYGGGVLGDPCRAQLMGMKHRAAPSWLSHALANGEEEVGWGTHAERCSPHGGRAKQRSLQHSNMQSLAFPRSM